MTIWKRGKGSVQLEADSLAAENYAKKIEQTRKDAAGLLSKITRTVRDDAPRIAAKLDDYWPGCIIGHSRLGSELFYVANFQDGFTLVGSTEVGLVRTTHRLSVPDSGDLNYKRRVYSPSYVEDATANREYTTVKDIAADNVALDGLQLLSHFTDGQSDGWPNACTVKMLEQYRRHDEYAPLLISA